MCLFYLHCGLVVLCLKERIYKTCQLIKFIQHTDNDSNQNDPAEVIRDHFKYMNERDGEKILSTLTEDWHEGTIDWKFDNLEKIEIVKIELEEDEKEMEGYLINGRGSDNRVTEDNLLIYKVTLDEQYKDDDIAIVPGGTYIYNYFLIRTDKDSPWLIDDYGLEM